MTQVISVFGSSMIKPGDPDYTDAQAVGGALAQAGYAVMTGGYGGLMEAASRGANEANGHVIGVTATPIEMIRPGIKANRWVKEIVPNTTLEARLDYLIKQAAGYVIMPGGVGTLNELILTWEYMRVNVIPVRPLVCFGQRWERVLTAFMDERYVPDTHWAMIRYAHSAAEVVKQLQSKG